MGRVKAPWAFRKERKNERHGGYRGRWYYQVIQGDMYVIHEGEYFLLMYGKNKTCKQSNDSLHPLMGKIPPLETRAPPPPEQHLRPKQDAAIPSSRHVMKDMNRNETRAGHKPFGGPPFNKRKLYSGIKCTQRGEKINLL